MSAPTVAVEWLLARAAVRHTGLLHVVSRRDSGALNPVCGANPIRSREIDTPTRLDDVALLCDGCGAMAASMGGTVLDGVALLLGLNDIEATTRLLDLPVTAIRANRSHPRQSAGDGMDGLVDSVRENGILQPIIVRRTDAGHELVAGARRLYAARVAGLDTIPAIVTDRTAANATVDALVENLHRADLNPIELAHAYSRALEVLDCSKAELGRRLGISREQVSNTIRLLGLPAEDQERIAAGKLTAEGGRALLRAPRPAAAPMPDVADLLAGVLAAKVKVVHSADRTRITLDVPDTDLARVLAQLGIEGVAA